MDLPNVGCDTFTMIEQLEDIVENLADQMGVYGSHSTDCDEKHPCRACWTAALSQRIREALAVEYKLKPHGR